MTSRRTVLAAAVGAAGLGVPLVGTIGAASAASGTTAGAARAARRHTVPETLARRVTSRGRTLAVPEASFPLTHLAISWTAPAGVAGPAVRVRSRSGWGAWQRPAPSDGGKEPRGKDTAAQKSGTPRRRHALLTVPSGVGYEIAASSAAAAVSVTELNTIDGPARTVAAGSTTTLPKFSPLTNNRLRRVPYLTRAQWGADETLRFRDGAEYWPAEYYPVQTLTVHHTAGANNDPDPAATVRAIYYYDTVTQDWGDMGYNLLIDEAGNVYEGRWSGTDPAMVFDGPPSAGRLPLMSGGAHVGGYNAGNIGVTLLGDFSNRLPTPAAQWALTVVLADLAKVTNLNPAGTTNYVNPVNGNTRTVRTISGHRDWAATLCPGDMFYPVLPAVRRTAAQLVRG